MGSKNPQAIPISILIVLLRDSFWEDCLVGNLYLLRIGQALCKYLTGAFDVIKTRLQVQGSTLRYNGCYMQSSIRMADDAQEVAQR
ncbi:hypothetical protein PRUPE_7G221800 [Prunus persica]|uniref:Uncharacterized protein n=1 Tax=Prunus persica TaxID=3760 RepID=A0A251NF94_PRUPE|nr:hypothetical protein PRUPE_7G221800 [Prunus persica]